MNEIDVRWKRVEDALVKFFQAISDQNDCFREVSDKAPCVLCKIEVIGKDVSIHRGLVLKSDKLLKKENES